MCEMCATFGHCRRYSFRHVSREEANGKGRSRALSVGLTPRIPLDGRKRFDRNGAALLHLYNASKPSSRPSSKTRPYRRTTAAADDLEAIAEYLFETSPQNAPQLILKIREAQSNLKNFPNMGRLGMKEGTRELVITPL